MDRHVLKELQVILDEIFQRFTSSKEGHAYDFYKEVVPYTKEVDAKLDLLIEEKQNIVELPYMNPMKFDNFIEHFKELTVECHFDKSRKLFIEKHKAVTYDLNYIQQHLGDIDV
ncbi:DUF1798 family protein [Staphylococcus massiliensis]|uniref:DUF1798 family protein n=1 Tax=Staphylococcus massiliensis S46 TaxID=1229783 RepID=K9B114_9STAP|nr:DUF1798 family protein [Staphylococcus massiliensis]EKU47475.1 hypothetical protein C273_07252 [Staphylococcus massiliensis S46]MCG3398882.1 YppE family protein [Staphylococcus massiliensis]MCG3401115.1 YppE family protein [Staphylococcus massiliensis]POA01110.1 DUF1798 domain-containing protein [Staphylococcus massiliensis CCUG 55927]